MNGNSSQPSFADKAYQYALDVVAGAIPTCKWTRKACERHLSDLSRSDGQYVYDPAKGNRVCAFISMLPHVSGRWAAARERIRLEPWQCFIVCSLFGWLKATTGKRRFSLAYIAVPRKNAKSTLAAAIALYCLIFDGEVGAQVFAGATTEKQAHMVFDPARQMVLKTPELVSRFGVEVAARSIMVPSTNSKFECLIGKPGDGGSPSLAIVDEYHEHLTSDLLDTMVTGSVAREQPLTFIITTAGSNIGGPCHLLQEDIEKTLDGVITNDHWFGLIYGMDRDDDWASDLALQKANPNLGISVNLDTLQQERQVAIQSADKQNIFRTKHLNQWVNAAVGFYDLNAWSKCYDPDLKPEAFEHQDCIIGLDLASKLDLCAAVKVFVKQVDGVDHLYVLPRTYLPEAQVNKPENRHYQKWVSEGYLKATDGNATDYQTILDDLMHDSDRFHVRELCFDPHEATYLTQVVRSKLDIELVEIPQRKETLSEPTKWLQSLIISGRIHHPNDPVLTWCLSNVIAKEDPLERVFAFKSKPELKIDAVAALLDALCRVREVLIQPQTTKQYIFEVW